MSNSITELLANILAAKYGEEVRGSIHDAIELCYTDGKAGANDLQARQLIEAVAAVNEEQAAALEVLQARVEELESGEGGSSQQSTTIDIPTVLVDGGVVENVSVNNNSTTTRHITFTTEFTETPKVMVAIGKNVGAVSQYGYLSANILYPTVTTTGFDFFLANRTGSDRSPGVVWYAYQPTVKTIDLDITIPETEGMTEAEVREITGPIAAAVDALKTGYDGTSYQTAAEAVRTQINDLHVLIGDEPGTTISADSVGYEDGSVADALDGLNGRLEVLEGGGTGGTGIPSNVRQAIYALFEHGAYKDADMSEEKAVVYAWANAPTAITLDKSTITLGNAGTSQITATTTPAGAAVTWSTSNSAVATVSNSGLVTAVGNGSCTITATSGDVSATCAVTVSGMLSMFSVTNNLTNCTNSNSATAVTENDSYSATLTADSGYALRNVTVTMGGTDITSSAYSNGSISIATVTGNVVITATAIVPPAWEDGVPYTFTWTDDKYITGSGAVTNFSGLSVSNYAGCDGVSSVTVENHTGQTIQYTGWYDSSKTFISKMNTVLNNQTGTMTPPENAAFFRITVKTDGKSGLTVTPTA